MALLVPRDARPASAARGWELAHPGNRGGAEIGMKMQLLVLMLRPPRRMTAAPPTLPQGVSSARLRAPGGARRAQCLRPTPAPGRACGLRWGPRPLLTRRVDRRRGCHLARKARRAPGGDEEGRRGAGRPTPGRRGRRRPRRRRRRRHRHHCHTKDGAGGRCLRALPPPRPPAAPAFIASAPSSASSSGFSLCHAAGGAGPRLPRPGRSTARLGAAGGGWTPESGAAPSGPRRCPSSGRRRGPSLLAGSGSPPPPGVRDASRRGAVPRPEGRGGEGGGGAAP